jgi:hypothetical protein
MKRLFGIPLFVLGASFALAADKNSMKLLKAAEAGDTLAIERLLANGARIDSSTSRAGYP